ncbi:MAG: hypothetical protein AMXMBFR84_26260 [Candidatus Hydrogenedentota bacterium]
MIDLTPDQLHILQHSIGADKYGQLPKTPYRNYYCTYPEGDAIDDLRALVAAGLMVDRGQLSTNDKMIVFQVTPAGQKAMKEASPDAPKVSRSQRRYERYLSWKDAWDGSFRDFLRYEKERRA